MVQKSKPVHSDYSVLAICLIGISSVFFGLLFGSLFLSAVMAVCGFVLVAFSFILYGSGRMSLIVAGAFILGSLVASLIYYGYIRDYGIPYWLPGLDDISLENDAFQCVSKGYYSVWDMVNGNTTREITHNAKGYVIFLSYLIRFGILFDGYHTMVPRIINVSILNLSALFITRLYLDKFPKMGKMACCLYLAISLFPNSLYVSSHVYRDTIAATILTIAYFICFSCTKRRHVLFRIAGICFLLYEGYWIRGTLVAFIAAIIIVRLLPDYVVSKKTPKGVRVKSLAFSALILIVVIAALMQFGDTLTRYVEGYGDYIVDGGSGILAAVYRLPLVPFGTIARLLLYLIMPFYYSIVFNPLSWFASTQNLFDVLISIGTCVLVAHYLYLVRAFSKDRKIVYIIILFLLAISLTTSGYRHILMVYPFIFYAVAEGRSSIDKASLTGKNNSFIKGPVIVGFAYMAFFGILAAMVSL